MSTTLTTIEAQPQKTSALALMAGRLNVDPAKLHQTLKSTVFKGASDEEMLALVVVANEYHLNPLTKQIYAFPAKGGGIVPVVSIDGWIGMVNDHPQMDGMEFEAIEQDGALKGMTCRIYRKDRSKPIEVTEWLSECKRQTEPWKMERRMLRHKALMQCARYAFGFSGVTDEDEASETPGLRNVTPAKAEPAKIEPLEVEQNLGDALIEAVEAPAAGPPQKEAKAYATSADPDLF
jgi:phage recombination protein Bet